MFRPLTRVLAPGIVFVIALSAWSQQPDRLAFQEVLPGVTTKAELLKNVAWKEPLQSKILADGSKLYEFNFAPWKKVTVVMRGDVVRLIDVVPPERASAELELLRGLSHPNLAGLLDYDVSGNEFFLVSEYVAGGNLQDRIARSAGRLSIPEVTSLVEQCLEALQHAHERGLVHSNIKPGNLLISEDGRQLGAKLADSGVQRSLDKVGLSGVTVSAVAGREYCFTPRERWTGFANSLPASDLRSLAATFYYALSGVYAYDFDAKNPIAVILNEEPVLLRDRTPAIPNAVAAVIDRALRPDPAERFQSASAMLMAWQQACGTSQELR